MTLGTQRTGCYPKSFTELGDPVGDFSSCVGRSLSVLGPSPLLGRPPLVQQLAYSSRDLPSEIGRDCIAHLDVLLGSASTEEVVVRKRLKTGGFSDRYASALARVGVDEVVAVLRYVTGDSATRLVA